MIFFINFVVGMTNAKWLCWGSNRGDARKGMGSRSGEIYKAYPKKWRSTVI